MTIAKTVARLILPQPAFERLRSIRSRIFQRKQLESYGVLKAGAEFIDRYGLAVRYGSFAGMVYPRDSAESRNIIPKLLGTYEQEIQDAIRQILTRQYDVVIDIGSAEGYYAVGFARAFGTRVLAYDPEPIERAFCTEMARLNGVNGLVELRDLFLAENVAEFREMRVLCLCDCEGFEEQIFTRNTVQDTKRWDLIIELHGRAQQTVAGLPWPHTTAVIDGVPRTGTFAELEGLGDPQKLLSEFRGERPKWLWCDCEV